MCEYKILLKQTKTGFVARIYRKDEKVLTSSYIRMRKNVIGSIKRAIERYNRKQPADNLKLPTITHMVMVDTTPPQYEEPHKDVARLWRRPRDWDNTCYHIPPTIQEAVKYSGKEQQNAL